MAGGEEWIDRYGGEPRKGADILVQALEREGVRQLFAYPGGASMEIHQALTRSPLIRNILCRHEQVLGRLLCMFCSSCGVQRMRLSLLKLKNGKMCANFLQLR